MLSATWQPFCWNLNALTSTRLLRARTQYRMLTTRGIFLCKGGRCCCFWNIVRTDNSSSVNEWTRALSLSRRWACTNSRLLMPSNTAKRRNWAPMVGHWLKDWRKTSDNFRSKSWNEKLAKHVGKSPGGWSNIRTAFLTLGQHWTNKLCYHDVHDENLYYCYCLELNFIVID